MKLGITFRLARDNELARALPQKHRLEVLRDVGGELTIRVDSKPFFHEPYVALLEFGIALEEWLRNCRNKKMEDFAYETMLHDQPILEFRRETNGNWIIRSIWQLFESEETLSTDELLTAVDAFLKALKAELYDSYGLKLEDYMWKSE